MGERWLSGPFAYVTPEKAASLEANHARPSDIIFTQRGTLGQVCLVPEEPFRRYLVSQSQMKLTVNRDVADALFIYYVFRALQTCKITFVSMRYRPAFHIRISESYVQPRFRCLR